MGGGGLAERERYNKEKEGVGTEIERKGLKREGERKLERGQR